MILDIENLTTLGLNGLLNKESIIDIYETLDDQIKYVRPTEARDHYNILLEWIESAKISPTFPKSVLDKIIEYSRLIGLNAIPFLTDEQFLDFTKNNLVFGYQNEVDFAEKIAIKLDILTLTERSFMMDKIIDSLRENEEQLGGASFQLNTEGAPLKGSVKRWMQYYDENLGAAKNNSAIRVDFIHSDSLINSLTKADALIVNELLALYDDLKNFSIEEIDKILEEDEGAEVIQAAILKRQAEVDADRKKTQAKKIKDEKKLATEESDPKAVPIEENQSQQKQKSPSDRVGPPVAKVGRTFGSLGDLEFVDTNMIRNTEITIPQFVRNMKSIVDKSAAEDPATRKQLSGLWKKSPLYQLYTEIGKESVSKNISLDKVIAARKKSKMPTLTKEEFTSIADLSHKLT